MLYINISWQGLLKMSRFNVENNHAIMPVNYDTSQYENVDYYCSIHSEDRNVLKYPNSGSFEIEFPRDYHNVSTLTISDMAMPIISDLFNVNNNNVYLAFTINKPYYPFNADGSYTNSLQYVIYQALVAHIEVGFTIQIENGTYSVDQMITELTRKMNEAVSYYLEEYIAEYQPTLSSSFTSYEEFVIVYNYINAYLWFGNRSSGFIIQNTSTIFREKEEASRDGCINRYKQREFVNWGLPSNLGFTREDSESIESTNAGKDVRFYYGDVTYGDNGYWLTPNSDLPGASCFYIQPPYKLNIFGDPYVYLYVDGWNTIDVTYPFFPNEYTSTSNATNGAVESAYGKISLGTTPVALTFVGGFFNPRVYNPPLNRVRTVKMSFRYHNGLPLDFGNMFFSMTFRFSCLRLKNKTN